MLIRSKMPFNTKAIHHAEAKRASTFGNTLKNFHSLRSVNRWGSMIEQYQPVTESYCINLNSPSHGFLPLAGSQSLSTLPSHIRYSVFGILTGRFSMRRNSITVLCASLARYVCFK